MEPIKIIVTSYLSFCAAGLPQVFIDDLREDLIIRNPAYINGLRFARGGRRFDVAPFLFALWKDGDNLIVARGFARRFFNLCHKHRIPFEVENRCANHPAVDFIFTGALYGYQADALNEVEKRRFGILVGPLGCGKRVLALALVARRQSPSLIVVTTKRQLYLWRELIRRFLGLDEKAIGQIGDGQKRIGKITVAITDSLYRVIDEAREAAGFLIIDQAETANLNVLRKIVLPFDGLYMLGLCNRRERTDGLTDIMTAYLGEVLHEIKLPGKFAGLGADRPRLIVKQTAFNYPYRDDFKELITGLCRDRERNSLLVADILQQSANPSIRVLVLSDRIEHLKAIKEGILQAQGQEAAIITGETGDKERREIAERFRKRAGILMMTYRSLGGVDIRGIDRLFITVPIKNGDYIGQAVGALVAGGGASDETGRVFDYRDVEVPVLDSSFLKRRKLYAAMGVVLEGSVD